MAENAKQEIELTLGGRAYSVRPTFEIITSIEAAVDASARELGMRSLAASQPAERRGGFKEISLTEMAVALFWMLKGQKGAPDSVAEIGKILMEDGYQHLWLPVGEFLIRAQRGNAEHGKEATQGDADVDPTKRAAGSAKT